MRTIPPELQARLDSGATTLCWCWRIMPRVGVALGFTDHDRDIEFDGTIFEAASGFTASEVRSSVGLSVDNLEVEGALSSTRLSEEALVAGDFDDAEIEIYRVDWAEPDLRILVRKGSLGEVRRSGSAFAVEVRGIAHRLQHPQGRVFQYSCDAELGDASCGIDLDNSLYRGSGTVSARLDDRSFSTNDLANFSSGWFTRGLLRFTSGANAGRAVEVRRHAVRSAASTLELWQSPRSLISPGDTFDVTAGCDKQLATCRSRFSNVVNYRGFPHLPGNDFLSSPRRA